MAGIPSLDASPSVLLTAPGSAGGSRPTLPIVDSTLVLGATATTLTPTPSPLPHPTTTTGCIPAIPGRHGYVPARACRANWAYDASAELALLFVALYGVSLSAHVAQAARARKLPRTLWPWPLLAGCVLQAAAFTVRAAGALDQQSRPRAAAAQALGLAAPVLLGAFPPAVLGAMVRAFVPDGRLLRVSGPTVALAFACLAVEVFVLEGAGALLLVLPPGDNSAVGQRRESGARVALAGLACQQAYVVIFSVFVARFHLVAARLKKERYPLPMFRPWRTTLAMLYASLTLMSMRNIFRLVQFGRGPDAESNPLLAREWYFLRAYDEEACSGF